MYSAPRSIPPGTTLHRDASGRYYLHAGGPAYPPQPTLHGVPSPLFPTQVPTYSPPPGHVLVPVADLQHLISNQNVNAGGPHHSVHSIHPSGAVHDVSHSHPHLHGSSPQTTTGAAQSYPRWSQ